MEAPCKKYGVLQIPNHLACLFHQFFRMGMESMSYLKGKSALMLFDRHPEYRRKWGDRHFWARGYYVATVGNVNEETILKYIQEQEENDKLEDGRK